MAKFLGLLTVGLSLVGALTAEAGPCKVYGITDGPQSLICQFPSGKVKLSCINGQYILGGLNVTQAYHLEVESGSTPLVFQAPDLKLTATKMTRFFHAELESKGVISHGTCH